MANARNEFPRNREDFDADERISWSKPDNKFILEEANGNEWEFDDRLKRWVPTVDKDLLEQQGKAYQVAGVDESEDVSEQIKAKKRKMNGGGEGLNQPRKRRKRQGKNPQTSASSAVYATSIPLDATYEDIDKVFSKYGIILESPDSEKKRIKMYTDEQGNFKGEALIIYYRPESVPMVINMLDDTAFDFKQGANGNMRVQVADSSFKKQKVVEGDEKPAWAPKKTDKQRADAKRKEMQDKLTDWGDNDGYELPTASDGAGTRWEKTVILKHMFTLHELEEDPEAEDDIQADIMEEAMKFGEVEKLYVFNEEPAGVVTVKFTDQAAAKQCVRAFNGRSFDGRTVLAYIADGKELFKKSKRDDEAKEKARLEQFGRELQSGALAKDVDGKNDKSGED
ncbi:nuclear mrna splicing factor-associated protein [Diplodia corticola]|uniref:Nuclear mrna splicing factor-associated protein n=1 Tax=Diplodia corticola TaxID=236234 RepID=A0A1J9RYL7_9PEZI|nr:nuclear mrna splicing factor-associated protein [Diplodia corticola]OJD37763.1 nuclear mrna splicing factor-associated protein [Diplodia corticola]